MSLRTISLISRRTNPAILPIAQTRSGNNKPKSLQKTKRLFKPNLTRVDWPVTLLAPPTRSVQRIEGEDGVVEESEGVAVLKKLRGVKMQMRRVRDVEKAGGIEGLLLSRRPKDLTPYGRTLRTKVFEELHKIKDILDAGGRYEPLSISDRANPATQSIEGGKAEEDIRLIEGR